MEFQLEIVTDPKNHEISNKMTQLCQGFLKVSFSEDCVTAHIQGIQISRQLIGSV